MSLEINKIIGNIWLENEVIWMFIFLGYWEFGNGCFWDVMCKLLLEKVFFRVEGEK